MEKREAMLWVATLQAARRGEKEAQETLRQENELRAELRMPSVEEELRALL